MKLKKEHGWYLVALFGLLNPLIAFMSLIILAVGHQTNPKQRSTIKKAIILDLVLIVINIILAVLI